jgi:hypothetical protein
MSAETWAGASLSVSLLAGVCLHLVGEAEELARRPAVGVEREPIEVLPDLVNELLDVLHLVGAVGADEDAGVVAVNAATDRLDDPHVALDAPIVELRLVADVHVLDDGLVSRAALVAVVGVLEVGGGTNYVYDNDISTDWHRFRQMGTRTWA